MTGFLDVMGAPLAACGLLVLIHAMLGQHVLARGVIFVDLAMAQIAALGAAVAFRLGVEPHAGPAYAASLAFTLIGAALFAFFWDRSRPVLQEAFIGVAFVVASAAAMLLLVNAPHGADWLQGMLGGGGLLWVSWADVGVMAAMYAAVAAWLIRNRRALDLCSADPLAAARRGLSVRTWDFLFYVAFGIVVTSSVRVAGVLAVFAFLIVPCVCAALLGCSGAAQLRWAWGIGFAGAAAAVAASYRWDLPTGATVVVAFGAIVLAVTLASRSRTGDAGRFRSRPPTLSRRPPRHRLSSSRRARPPSPAEPPTPAAPLR